jgi:Fringe-like
VSRLFIMSQLIIAVGTCDKNQDKQAACLSTWIPRITTVYETECFMYQATNEHPETRNYRIIGVGGKDDYYSFLDKTIRAFEYALKKYRSMKWLFKCDDDTYIHVVRLIELIQRHPTADLIGNQFITQHGHASGGAGYVLNRAMVEAVVAARDEILINPQALEDVAITGWVRKQTKKFVATCKLRHYHDEVPTKMNDRITGHHLTPENMYATDSALFSLRTNF